jgi:alkylhydroperoxidase family enzyme
MPWNWTIPLIHRPGTVPAMTTATQSLHQRISAGALAPAGYQAMAAFSDDGWADAAAHFDDAELAQLVWAIAVINTWNRIGVATHLLPSP